MPARTCKHCGGLTPSPCKPVCNRPACRAQARDALDAIVEEAVQGFRAELRKVFGAS